MTDMINLALNEDPIEKKGGGMLLRFLRWRKHDSNISMGGPPRKEIIKNVPWKVIEWQEIYA